MAELREPRQEIQIVNRLSPANSKPGQSLSLLEPGEPDSCSPLPQDVSNSRFAKNGSKKELLIQYFLGKKTWLVPLIKKRTLSGFPASLRIMWSCFVWNLNKIKNYKAEFDGVGKLFSFTCVCLLNLFCLFFLKIKSHLIHLDS